MRNAPGGRHAFPTAPTGSPSKASTRARQELVGVRLDTMAAQLLFEIRTSEATSLRIAHW